MVSETGGRYNICIFNGDMSRGGGTERITALLSGMLARISRYDVWVLSAANETGKSFFELDGRVHTAALTKRGVLGKIFELSRFIRKNRIDVLINVDVMLGIFSLPAAMLHPSLSVIAWEMFNLRNDIGSKHTVTVRRLSLRRCAAYITQTKGDMEAFLAEMPVRCPIDYIYNPCFGQAGVAYDIDSKTIVTAGNFFYTKGFDLAIETAKKVFCRHGDWKWELYGDGERLEETKRAAHEAGLDDNVIFRKRSSSMDEIYRHAAMYVMTSRTEGFGLVLTEAKSFALPTLAFDIDFGPREIIEDGKSGFLVPAFDTDALAERICLLIEDREMRAEFSRHAGDNLDKFSPDEFCRRWTNVIDAALGTKRRKRK